MKRKSLNSAPVHQLPLFYPSRPILDQSEYILRKIRHKPAREAIQGISASIREQGRALKFFLEQAGAIQSEEARVEIKEFLTKLGVD